jgi:hypothetical protein
MMMVETYETLPHLKYLGKYPSHIVTPTNPHKSTPQQSASETLIREPSTSPLRPLVPKASTSKSSPQPSSSRKNGYVPRKDPSTSPGRKQGGMASPETKRGRSMERTGSRNSLVDSYRPSREGSRSSSWGRLPPRGIDRYSPEQRRGLDSYVPRRKRSVDVWDDPGRAKRTRDSEDRDISEGEVR